MALTLTTAVVPVALWCRWRFTPECAAQSLHDAAYEGDLSRVRKLPWWGAPLEAIWDQGWTPLLRAVQRGHFDIVDLLLREGANVRFRDPWGRTCLHLALFDSDVRDQEPLLRSLLSAGADPNVPDQNGDTPLLFSMKTYVDDPGIYEALLASGADPNYRNPQPLPPTTGDWIRFGLGGHLLATEKDAWRSTPLELARNMEWVGEEFRLSLIDLLVRHGATE